MLQKHQWKAFYKPVAWIFHVGKGLLTKWSCALRAPRLLAEVPEAAFSTYRIGDPPTGEGRSAADIPRIIWSYWNSPNVPFFVRRCAENWHRLCPDFSIRMLNDDNLAEYLPDFPRETPNLIPAKRADWIRMELLARYGGIWLDATTVLTRSLDWAIAEQRQSRADFVGYWIGGMTAAPDCPVVENWFLAAPPASPFMADWRREFVDGGALHDARGYLSRLRSREDVDGILQHIDSPEYLSCHVAAQVILHGGGRYVLRLVRAEDDAFVFQDRYAWSRDRMWNALAFCRVSESLPRLVKWRTPDRKYRDEILANRVYLKGSFVDRYLG